MDNTKESPSTDMKPINFKVPKTVYDELIYLATVEFDGIPLSSLIRARFARVAVIYEETKDVQKVLPQLPFGELKSSDFQDNDDSVTINLRVSKKLHHFLIGFKSFVGTLYDSFVYRMIVYKGLENYKKSKDPADFFH